MDDRQIIELYLARNEKAITETDKKYKSYCTAISMNILHNAQDAEECVNDTYLTAWGHIPPDRPDSLRLYLGHIARHLSINRWRFLHAAKRNRDMEVALDELENCIPAPDDLPTEQQRQLTEDVNAFLRSLSQSDRVIFVLRYYHAKPQKEIAEAMGMTVKAVSKRLILTREGLRVYLNERGYRL